MTEEEAEELAKQIVEKVIKPRDGTSVFYTPHVESIKHAIRQAYFSGWLAGYQEGIGAREWARGVALEMVQDERKPPIRS